MPSMDIADWQKGLKARREKFQITQADFAFVAAISETYYCELETGRRKASALMRDKIEHAFDILSPNPLYMLIDYVKIRFKTTNAKYVIENILQIKIRHMAHEDKRFNHYDGRYYYGNIEVFHSADEAYGTILELKGQGCRQIESIFNEQKRGWYGFFWDCLEFEPGCVFKRIDLAINDRVGLLNIPYLISKCESGECITLFNKHSQYSSGEFIKGVDEQYSESMGKTLYLGSTRSNVYFCIYEKDYEQLSKNGIALEDTEVKNRFELRLKNNHALNAVKDLCTYADAERISFSYINYYMRIADRNPDVGREYWKNSREWELFIGDYREKMKLATRPKPFKWERTLNWLSSQVAATLKTALMVDETNGTNIIQEMLDGQQIPERLRSTYKQLTTDTKQIITTDERS